ncbi:MAG TPA: hypothetical protein VMW91_05870 [Desulfosporosinus sp.]|nr:hypothetical protein [Desulfosporosinus sp.]
MKAVIDMDNQSAVGYIDVYEDGDEWKKIQGCEVCPLETKKKCCHDCYSSLPNGDCEVHEKGKPFNCIVAPSIKMCITHCSLEYQCVKGTNIGKIRRVKDLLNVFITP